jgi:hypothetical protein
VKKLLIVLGVLVVVGIVAIVVTALVAKDKFQPYAEKVLTDLNAGKEAEVYAGASAPFKRDVTPEKFRDYVTSRRQALGEFKRVVKGTGGGISASTDSGTIGSVSLDLEFAKGPAEGEFRFLKEGDDWKLLEMKVTWSSPDRAVLEGRCQELLALYGASSFTALYAKFSAPLQAAWKAEAYEPQIRDLFAKAGKPTSATRRETKDAGDEKVQVTFDVQFEKGPGEATFGWDGRGAGWELVEFDLHLGKR